MSKLVIALLAGLLIAFVALGGLRIADARADRSLCAALLDRAGRPAPVFSLAMLDDLPEPARRFFRFAIAPGTPLHTIALIGMSGELSLGGRDDPGYQPMTARQVLAPPHGLLWQVRLQAPAGVTGTDALTPDNSWSRFRVLDLVPVGRVTRDADHRLSVFGRMVGEGLIWTPAAFLPAAGAGWDHIEWQEVAPDTVAVLVRHRGLELRTELSVGPDGRPVRVVFQRWSNENPERVYRFQPFGGDLAGFRDFGGFTLPTQVVGGNHFGTDLYHPFYRAKVETMEFR